MGVTYPCRLPSKKINSALYYKFSIFTYISYVLFGWAGSGRVPISQTLENDRRFLDGEGMIISIECEGDAALLERMNFSLITLNVLHYSIRIR